MFSLVGTCVAVGLSASDGAQSCQMSHFQASETLAMAQRHHRRGGGRHVSVGAGHCGGVLEFVGRTCSPPWPELSKGAASRERDVLLGPHGW